MSIVSPPGPGAGGIGRTGHCTNGPTPLLWHPRQQMYIFFVNRLIRGKEHTGRHLPAVLVYSPPASSLARSAALVGTVLEQDAVVVAVKCKVDVVA